ncbi:MAG: hypothetical protein IKS96_03520 [Fibrobacter sp.]|nr:hypothetical protein [Fibrobacter sp.]
MTLKSTIIALLLICVPLLAETPASVFADSLNQGKNVVDSVAQVDSLADSARNEKESPVPEPDEESEDEVAMDEPPEVDFETTTTPLVKGKTGIVAIDTLPVNEWDIPTKRNSLKYAMLFSLLPGGGQYYTEHYVRGGFLTGIEGLLIYDIFFNRSFQRDRLLERAQPFQDSVLYFSSRIMKGPRDSILYYHDKRLEFLERVRAQSDKKMEQEDVRKAELAWLIGIHLYGMFDTFGIWYNNNRRSTEYRDMKTAILWALLPGGGQIFNRDFGKAGLVYMGLLGASVSVWTSQNMVNYYLDRKHLVEKESPRSEEYDRIVERVTYYRKNRNTYIWGGVLIYLYSIADAAVDALLSDFDSPLHLALVPNFDGGAQAVMTLDF